MFLNMSSALTMSHTTCLLLLGLFGVLFLQFSTATTGFYADNGLQQTAFVHEVPDREMRAIKQEILTLLGLHHRPRPTLHGTEDSAPSYMMNLYKTLQDEGDDVEGDGGKKKHRRRLRRKLSELKLAMPGMEKYIEDADTIMSFVNHGKGPHKVRHSPNNRFYFDFTEVSPEDSLIGAELRMYKTEANKWEVGNSTYTIKLYRVTPGEEQEQKSLAPEVTVSVSGAYEGWVDANVTNAASSWVVSPGGNLGLYMKVTNQYDQEVDPVSIGLVDRKGPEGSQPFLVGFFTSPDSIPRRTRPRRSTKKNKRKPEVTYSDQPYGRVKHKAHLSGICQRRILYVNFKDLGWHGWIIAPDGYSAFFCAGECSFPLNVQVNATNHAIVQTLVHLMRPSAAPKASCAPTKLTAISVLYFDDNSNVILKKYKNMAVRACGCQ